MSEDEASEVEVRAPASHETPFLRVVSPSATPEEVAALVAVFASLGGDEPERPQRRSAWSHPARMHRTPHRAAPDGWRSSGLPR